MRVETANTSPIQTVKEEPGFCASLAALIQKIWDFFFSSCCLRSETPDLNDRSVQALTEPLPHNINAAVDDLSQRLNANLREQSAQLNQMNREFEERAVQRRNDLEKALEKSAEDSHKIALLSKESAITHEEGGYLKEACDAILDYIQLDSTHLPEDRPKDWLKCIYEKDGMWAFGGGVPMSIIFKLFKLDNAPNLTVSEYFNKRSSDFADNPSSNLIAGHKEAMFRPISENYTIAELHYGNGVYTGVKIIGVREQASVLAKKAELDALKKNGANAL